MLDLTSNTCLNGWGNRASDRSGWGPRSNAQWSNILFLDFMFSRSKACDANNTIIAISANLWKTWFAHFCLSSHLTHLAHVCYVTYLAYFCHLAFLSLVPHPKWHIGLDRCNFGDHKSQVALFPSGPFCYFYHLIFLPSTLSSPGFHIARQIN